MQPRLAVLLASLCALAACGDNNFDGDFDDDFDEDFDEDLPPPARCYVRSDLVGSFAIGTDRTDARLVNAWGLAPVFGSFAVVSTEAGYLEMYDASGAPARTPIPESLAIGPGYTGIATTSTELLLASEDGYLAALTPGINPTALRLLVDRNASGAGYLGVAVVDGLVLAADFQRGRIDVFDRTFESVSSPMFVDPTIPAGYAPFNVAVLDRVVYVTYALRDAATREEVPGAGRGYLSAFATNGLILWTMGGGLFDAPWGLAIAPAAFGDLGGTLLVGNAGDGRITAIDRATQRVVGQLVDLDGLAIEVDGLWGISGAGEVVDANPNAIYFAAGPADETEGLFGVLEPCQ